MTETTKHPTKALVLSGGGITATAWELGLIVGLHDGGAEVTDADVVVGTSAGAVVGAHITSGLRLEELYALQLKPVEGTREAVVPPDLAELRRAIAAGMEAADPQTARARIGGAALAATTISEAERLEMIADRLPVHEWPKQRLVLNAVDAQMGAWVTFDQQAGVPLVLAVAASCAVPGIYPPTAIQGHRYMDVGMSSGTNADFAQGYDRVLILLSTTGALSASAGQRDPIHRMTFDDELALLKQAGAHVLVMTPDEASAAASGPNPSQSPAFWRSFGPYDHQWHHYDQGHPDIHALYRELRQLLESYSQEQPRVSIGKVYRPDIGSWAAYYGRDLDELHLPFNFRLLAIPWRAQAVRRVVDELEAVIPTGAWLTYVLSNHDEPRLASRLGQAQARVAMLLLLTLRGTPTLHYGDELGMQNGSIPVERMADRWEQQMPGLSLGRDQERTPMLWDGSVRAGFCPPGVEPWLPVTGREEQGHVMAQLTDPRSMLSLTRRLLSLRRAHPALSIGDYLAVETDVEDCFVCVRQHGVQRYLIALNFAGSEQVLDLSPCGSASVILSTHLDREEHVDLAHLTLRGNEGCQLECQP